LGVYLQTDEDGKKLRKGTEWKKGPGSLTGPAKSLKLGKGQRGKSGGFASKLTSYLNEDSLKGSGGVEVEKEVILRNRRRKRKSITPDQGGTNPHWV